MKGRARLSSARRRRRKIATRRAELIYPKLLFSWADFSQAKGARPLGCRDREWSHVCGFGETLGIFGSFCSLKAALLSFRLRRPGDRRALPFAGFEAVYSRGLILRQSFGLASFCA